MKYFLFDGGDVVGPFTVQQLRARPGFSGSSLVCPESHSEDDDYWKVSAAYEDFGLENAGRGTPGSFPSEQETEEAEEMALQQEMSALVFEHDPLLSAVADKKKADAPSDSDVLASRNELRICEVRNTKPSPIEDYFNNINADDLGDILGIPDPNETSDLNLTRALKGETSPGKSKKEEKEWKDPFDDFAAHEPLRARDERKELEKELPPEKTIPPVSVSLMTQRESVSNTEADSLKKAPLAEEKDAAPVPADKDALTEQTKPVSPNPALQAEPVSAQTVSTETAPAKRVPAVEPALQESALLQASAESEMKVIDLDAPLPTEPAAAPAAQDDNEPEEIVKNLDALDTKPPVSASSSVVQDGHASEGEDLEEGVTHTFRAEFFPAQQLPADQPERMPEDDKVKKILQGEIEVEVLADMNEPIKNVKPIARKETEPEKVLHAMPEETVKRQESHARSHKKATLFFLFTGIIVLGGAIFFSLSLGKKEPAKKKPASVQVTPKPAGNGVFVPGASAPSVSAVTVRPRVRDGANPRSTTAAVPTAVLVSKAKEIVQNHTLPNRNVTIGNYFDRIYKDKFAEGFTASWSAEPLHQDVYIVKYRLSKTRKEPIIYIFQVDVSTGKITGALNNITIDLVGKIRQ